MRRLNMSSLLYLLSLLSVLFAERLHEQIYSSIEGGAACFRRLNGTHQAGCSSPDSGAIGVIHMVKKTSDAQWLVFNGTAGPYVAVVSTALFHNVYELFMEYPNNVAGILLYENATESVGYYTQDSRCPNEFSSDPGSLCHSSYTGGIVWNERGTDLLHRDVPFPIFFLSQSRIEEIVKIEQCYERYNLNKFNQKGKPLCSVQLNSFMFAAVNSAVCLRRSATSVHLTPIKVCDPLGDHNVYYSLFPRGKEIESTKKDVTLVTARIDTTSMFDGVAPGAASSVVGMTTLIAAASTLSKMIPVEDAHLYNQNVLWTLFNGEAFDYIGSQRVAYDISRGMWPNTAPLLPNQIKLHVEVGQIGGSLMKYKNSRSWPLYGFSPYDNVDMVVKNFLTMMSNNSYHNDTVMSPIFTTNLPPSSLHSFRRILMNTTEKNDLLEVLLVDHNETFSNMYYNSVLDDYEKIDFHYRNISIGINGTFLSTEELIKIGTMKESDSQVKIARLATTLARALYQRIVGIPYEGDISTSAHMIDEMLYCFLRSQACRLLLAADYAQNSGGDESLPLRPASLYVGVAAWAGTAAVFAGHLLALLAGTQLDIDKKACDELSNPDYSYYWLRGWNHNGVCIQTTMNFSQAVSPAFLTPDYEFSSGEYSTWTESVWRAMSARVFVAAGGAGARAAAGAGLAATAAAALLTYWLQRHARTVFADAPAGSIVNSDAATGILRTVNC